MRRPPPISAFLLAASVLAAPARHTTAQDDADAAAGAARATVATHYFYWYKWPDEHFDQPGAPGSEGHARHFAAPALVDYESTDWHRGNFAAMARCGIDAALPVYWGAPGAYDRPGLRFSRRGLPAMVAALDAMADAGADAPRLGLFYDTTTLANATRGVAPRDGKADLTTAAGRALFCDTVTEYFAAIPQRHWARHRGGALVVLYVAGFAARWDETLGAALRAAFAARFRGETVCLVADTSWGEIGQDLTTAWCAALYGPQLFAGVAQIGPGYDDRSVPGRNTPVREREDGAFYDNSWRAVLRHRPELVLLETWNEMHEGTELCATLELGDEYERRTRSWIARLRAREAAGADVALRWPLPRPRPELSWGESAAGSDLVRCDYTGETPRRLGLRELAWPDGPLVVERAALRSSGNGVHGYLYFQVSDHFAFDVVLDLELVLERQAGPPLAVEYDSRDLAGTFDGSYTLRRPVASEALDDGWVRETYELAGARLANRQNGGSDLRLVLPDGRGAVRFIELRRH